MEDKKRINKNNYNAVNDPGTQQRSIVVILSFIICFAALIIGIIFSKKNIMSSKTAVILLLVLGLTPVVLTLIFMLVSALIGKKINKMTESVAKTQAFILANRENAEKSAKKERKYLLIIRFFTILWAVFLGISAISFNPFNDGIFCFHNRHLLCFFDVI